MDGRIRIPGGPTVILALVAVVSWVALSWAFATALVAAKTDLETKADKTFAFDTVRTWAWHPDGAGDVRMAVSTQDDPKRLASRVDPIIMPAVVREMTAKKLTPAAAESADVYVHYYVLATVTNWSQYQGQFIPAVPDWGLPPFMPQTSAMGAYPVGTLILDVSSREKQAIVWRGSAEREISLDKPDAERKKVLDSAVRDLLRRLPTKK